MRAAVSTESALGPRGPLGLPLSERGFLLLEHKIRAVSNLLCQFAKRRRPRPPESIGLVVQERVGGAPSMVPPAIEARAGPLSASPSSSRSILEKLPCESGCPDREILRARLLFGIPGLRAPRGAAPTITAVIAAQQPSGDDPGAKNPATAALRMGRDLLPPTSFLFEQV
ncbi:hypothetical protein EMIHUDRAFT_252983 [Emiliania huxleyi CCMP1516]|uniref:Uncharacterized protein n=2 Tax=Emiliania huxleyi TaxID=2903 RepID=A0A0D3KDZ8_EMIH1|nr:hypothetical protein EMIHUDRAFT_252983 [Emiliania huxleyi CCMP1516]EOD33983.1 hypothetical protein EMIHUDRAFT_252983 [Emiliania huxleyi CCMP1516]|eukprot:XP_005786412.1 hypothetical protein EMIHUDRAFT_252983 [Emiliania huxleyi CCMP1516]